MRYNYIYFCCILISCCLLVNCNLKSQVILQCERKYKISRRGAIDLYLKKEVWITIPKFVKIKKFRFMQISQKLYRVEVETYIPIPIKTKDNIRFTLYFPSQGIGITCGIGPSPYRSPAPSRFGRLQGGIYSPRAGKSIWIAPLENATVKGNKLIFDFSSKYVYLQEVHEAKFVIHYYPHRFKFKFTHLVDGVDFEYPDNEEIIHMTGLIAPPPR